MYSRNVTDHSGHLLIDISVGDSTNLLQKYNNRISINMFTDPIADFISKMLGDKESLSEVLDARKFSLYLHNKRPFTYVTPYNWDSTNCPIATYLMDSYEGIEQADVQEHFAMVRIRGEFIQVGYDFSDSLRWIYNFNNKIDQITGEKRASLNFPITNTLAIWLIDDLIPFNENTCSVTADNYKIEIYHSKTQNTYTFYPERSSDLLTLTGIYKVGTWSDEDTFKLEEKIGFGLR